MMTRENAYAGLQRLRNKCKKVFDPSNVVFWRSDGRTIAALGYKFGDRPYIIMTISKMNPTDRYLGSLGEAYALARLYKVCKATIDLDCGDEYFPVRKNDYFSLFEKAKNLRADEYVIFNGSDFGTFTVGNISHDVKASIG